MAKSIVLYGVLFGALVCLCAYFTGFGVGSYQSLDLNLKGTSPSVILSGAERSRKISAFKVRTPQPVEENFIRTQIKQIYSAEIGVREATGKNDGKRVEEYLSVTGLGKGYAWCGAFVSWVFAEAGFPQPRTPWSPALFPKTRVIWEKEKASASGLIPSTADIFGIYFANLKRIAHVGFVDEWGDKYLITMEGNTNEAGSNEGDGVYRKRRPISSIYQVSDWVKGQERRIE